MCPLALWQGPHRLFLKAGAGPVGGASSLGFTGASPEEGGYRDAAPPSMALPSRVRTVIAADFDNDGFEELFFNNIGQPNRLFKQVGGGAGGGGDALIGVSLVGRAEVRPICWRANEWLLSHVRSRTRRASGARWT